MYESYWQLKEKPFENTPDPRFFYYSSQHKEALSRLLYAVREKKGAALLSGEYGSGKTLLSRVILEELRQERYQVVLIFNPRLGVIEFFQEIIYQLAGHPDSNSKIELLHRLNKIFQDNHQKNKDTVVLIDEAQAIETDEVFEELRLLLNFQLNNEFLITLVLLGQPELKDKVDRFPQLDQRLSVRYHLSELDEHETKEYILHRLSIAGRTPELFTPEAVRLIYNASSGIPRVINSLCDMCLLVGFGKHLTSIDEETCHEVIKDYQEARVRRV